MYHGALNQVEYDNLRMDGPCQDKPFSVILSRGLAIEAAGGHPDRVLRYIILNKKG